jgi:hypothetical protein
MSAAVARTSWGSAGSSVAAAEADGVVTSHGSPYETMLSQCAVPRGLTGMCVDSLCVLWQRHCTCTHVNLCFDSSGCGSAHCPRPEAHKGNMPLLICCCGSCHVCNSHLSWRSHALRMITLLGRVEANCICWGMWQCLYHALCMCALCKPRWRPSAYMQERGPTIAVPNCWPLLHNQEPQVVSGSGCWLCMPAGLHRV